MSEILLGLLEGPTKQLVASAVLTAGGCGVLVERANCLTYRAPYDDDVFQGRGIENPASSVPVPALKGKAHCRSIGLSAIRTIMSPYNMGLTVARNMSLACLHLAHKHILLLTEAEERAIETGKEPEYIPFPWDDMPKALRTGATNSGLDVAVLSIRGLLDWGAIECFEKSFSEKLTTDLRRTARNMLQDFSAWQRLKKVLVTSLFSEITLFASEWLISCVLDSARVMIGKKQNTWKRLIVRYGMHGARCSSLWLAVSVGNGIGASTPKMQPLFMLLCTNIASFLVNTFYASLMSRVEDYMAFDDNTDGKKKDEGKDEGDDSDEPESPPKVRGFTSYSSLGPESPDMMTPLHSETMESPEMTLHPDRNIESIVQASPVTHTISTRGPRLPPRRRLMNPNRDSN